jgi:hypothetical protein
VIQRLQAGGPVSSLAFVPDNGNLFSAGLKNGCVKMFDLRWTKTQAPVIVQETQASGVNALVFVSFKTRQRATGLFIMF